MQNLKGKIAWVTGAGTGIGEGAALALAREGAIGGADRAAQGSRWRRWPTRSPRPAARRRCSRPT